MGRKAGDLTNSQHFLDELGDSGTRLTSYSLRRWPSYEDDGTSLDTFRGDGLGKLLERRFDVPLVRL